MEPSFPSYFFHKLYFREQVESILVNMKEKSDLERDFFWSDMLVSFDYVHHMNYVSITALCYLSRKNANVYFLNGWELK